MLIFKLVWTMSRSEEITVLCACFCGACTRPHLISQTEPPTRWRVLDLPGRVNRSVSYNAVTAAIWLKQELENVSWLTRILRCVIISKMLKYEKYLGFRICTQNPGHSY